MRPLLVGEANPYGSDPGFALYPYPTRASGHRLCTLIMGMEPRQYLRAFDRVNLCPERWSAPLSRANAQRIWAGDHTRIVLLGAKVSTAFGFSFQPFTVVQTAPSAKSFVILPHPSALNRAWNEPGAFDKARDTLVKAGILEAKQ